MHYLRIDSRAAVAKLLRAIMLRHARSWVRAPQMFAGAWHSSTILAIRTPAVVTQEMNLRNQLHQVRVPLWLLKLGQMLPEIQKKGYQWHHKKGVCPNFFSMFKKMLAPNDHSRAQMMLIKLYF